MNLIERKSELFKTWCRRKTLTIFRTFEVRNKNVWTLKLMKLNRYKKKKREEGKVDRTWWFVANNSKPRKNKDSRGLGPTNVPDQSVWPFVVTDEAYTIFTEMRAQWVPALFFPCIKHRNTPNALNRSQFFFVKQPVRANFESDSGRFVVSVILPYGTTPLVRVATISRQETNQIQFLWQRAARKFDKIIDSRIIQFCQNERL